MLIERAQKQLLFYSAMVVCVTLMVGCSGKSGTEDNQGISSLNPNGPSALPAGGGIRSATTAGKQGPAPLTATSTGSQTPGVVNPRHGSATAETKAGPGATLSPGIRPMHPALNPDAQARMKAIRTKFPGTMALMDQVRGIQFALRSDKNPLDADQASKLSAILEPLLTSKTLPQATSKRIAKQISGVLTPQQRADESSMQNRMRPGGVGRRPYGAGGWHGPGIGGQGSPNGGSPAGWHAGDGGHRSGFKGGQGRRPGSWGRGRGMFAGGLDPGAPADTNPYLNGPEHDRLQRLLERLSPDDSGGY